MLITTETSFRTSLLEALTKAKHAGKHILFSNRKKIDWQDALLFYAHGKGYGDGERFYWGDSSGESIITGIGATFYLNEGFQRTHKKWNELIDDAVFSYEEYVPGTGPLLFGGFAFDSDKEATPLWDDFGDHSFMLPKQMLTKESATFYLTSNIMVGPDDCLEDLCNAYEKEEEILFAHASIYWNEPNIIDSEEPHKEEWMEAIAQVVADIKEGNVQKVVLARELKLTFDCTLDSLQVLRNLRTEQTTSYLFSFDTGKSCFVGATPERLLRKKGNEFTSMCLAGSIERGKTEEEDIRHYNELLHDQKNLGEHQIVVKMIRDVMESFCYEVDIAETPSILGIRNLFHLYTPVRAIGNKDISLLSLVEKLHPTPALGGYPQEKARKLIREYENLDRGWYAAPIGWMDARGNGEFAVAIRSGIIRGKSASLFAGCGIVEESVPEEEYKETKVKFRPMLSALGGYKHES